MIFWIKETIWAFLVLGLFEAYWKEWAVKFTKWYSKPLLSLKEKALILPRVDELLINTHLDFAGAAVQAILEEGGAEAVDSFDKAVKEVAEIFDIDIFREKQLDSLSTTPQILEDLAPNITFEKTYPRTIEDIG